MSNKSMNETIKLLQSHRSIRKFTEQKIAPELLEQIIVSGQSAATSSFIQAVTLIRISDKALRQQLAHLAGDQPYVAGAAEFIVVCADWNRIAKQVEKCGVSASFDWAEQFITSSVDAALFAQNMVIAAQSEQLGCCYIGGIRNNPQKITQLLNLPKGVYPVFGLCFGYPDQHPEQKPRLPIKAILGENAYPDQQVMGQAIDEYDVSISEYYTKRTNGKMTFSWSEQMAKQIAQQTRPFILEFLREQGLLKR